MDNQLRYKGRFIKQNVLEKKIRSKEYLTKKHAEWRNISPKKEKQYPCEGNRIVNLQLLGKNLKCRACQNVLSLEDVVGENRTGLDSILRVKCNSCSIFTKVATGDQHATDDNVKELKANTYNLTTNAVSGAFYAGLGCTQLNKILACLDVPTIPTKMYKRFKQEIIIKEAAKRNCKHSTREEKKLALEKIEELSKELLKKIQNEFVDEYLY